MPIKESLKGKSLIADLKAKKKLVSKSIYIVIIDTYFIYVLFKGY